MDCISGWCSSKRRLEGITAIITGSNSGIGKETAFDFYKRGARVIMACRNIEKAESARIDIVNRAQELKGTGSLVVEKIDLCSLQSVREFAAKILAREKTLQILVNNAGVMMCPEGKTEDGFETHIGSNHFGHALLTLLLLPKLISSAPSRIVCVSSDLHYFSKLDLDDVNIEKTPYGRLAAYNKSKVANVMFARALSQKLQEYNIKDVTTYSLHPGVVRTQIDKHMTQSWWSGLKYLYRTKLLGFMWKSPECGAQTTIYCAVDEKCANETGLYYSDCSPKSPSSQCLKDPEVAKLWNLTLQRLDLQEQNIFKTLS